LPASTFWQEAVTYGNGVFVAVAYSTIAATSTDGITWTQRTLPVYAGYKGATSGVSTTLTEVQTSIGGQGDGELVETLGQVAVYTVPTYRTAEITQITVENLSPNAITYDLGIVDFDVTLTEANTLRWDEQIPGDSTVTISSGFNNPLTEGKTIYVFPSAVDLVEVKVFGTESRVGVFAAIASSSKNAASSTDGITWTRRTLPVSAGWASVAYGDGVFVAIAIGGSSAANSTDGITWTQRTLPVSANWESVTYGDGVFVVMSGFIDTSTIAASSTDGITWTQRTLPDGRWRSVAYGGGVFAAVAQRHLGVLAIAASSTDGITWTQRTLPVDTDWHLVAYGDGKFVAIARFSDIAATSTDGVTWTQRTLPVSSSWASVAYGDGVFVAIAGEDPSSIAASSTDGITWTQRTMPTIAEWGSVTYGDGVFVALVAYFTIAATSTDGITWTQRTLPVKAPWRAVVYGD
jgi:hypothetical protein